MNHFSNNTKPAPTATTNNQGGYSLVELLVSIAIFAVVTTMAMVGLVSVIDASARSRAQSEAINNLNVVVDDMSRRVRNGYRYECTPGSSVDQADPCTNGGNSFGFIDSKTDNATIYRLNGDGQIERSVAGSSFQPITAPSLEITDLTFYVVTTAVGYADQSRVLVSIAGTAGAGDTTADFSLQTTLTRRLLYAPR